MFASGKPELGILFRYGPLQRQQIIYLNFFPQILKNSMIPLFFFFFLLTTDVTVEFYDKYWKDISVQNENSP